MMELKVWILKEGYSLDLVEECKRKWVGEEEERGKRKIKKKGEKGMVGREIP
jgi:hypothetical protein